MLSPFCLEVILPRSEGPSGTCAIFQVIVHRLQSHNKGPHFPNLLQDLPLSYVPQQFAGHFFLAFAQGFFATSPYLHGVGFVHSIDQSKSQGQPVFRVTGRRLHLLMGGAANYFGQICPLYTQGVHSNTSF